jgi:hypothetical protein
MREMMRSWDVDEDAVRAAAKQLGMRGHVRVSLVRFAHNRCGRYVRFQDGFHVISLDSSLSARAANKTLWHEITHAQQAERLGSSAEFHRRWRKEMRESGIRSEDSLRRVLRPWIVAVRPNTTGVCGAGERAPSGGVPAHS